MKCPNCSREYDENVHDKCPVCKKTVLEIENSLEINNSTFDQVPLDKNIKKKKSLAFYLIVSFLAFIVLTIAFITYSLNAFTNKIKISESEVNTNDSIETEITGDQFEIFDPFGNSKDAYTLDITHIYKTTDEFYKDIELLNTQIIPQFESFKGKLNTKENVKSAFSLYDTGYFISEKIYWYAQYQVSLDASDEAIQNIVDNSDSVMQTFTESTYFIWPELSSLDEERLKLILNYDGVTKEEYDRNLSLLLDMKNHILSTETEDALAMLTTFNSSPKNIWDKVTILDPIFNVYRLEDGTLIDFENDSEIAKFQSDKLIEPKLFEYYTQVERQNENTLAEILMSEVQKNIAYSKIKKYDSFLEYELSADEVPKELYLNLLDKIDANISMLHKYQALENKMYDDNLFPVISNEFSIDKSRELISNSYKFLGDDYIKRFNYAIDNNWFDLLARDYKEEGAYTSGMKLVHPYIIMTYRGSLDDLSTLTHEYGHMANYKYSQDKIDSSNWTPNAFTSEVPSTFNEALLSDYLRSSAKTTDEQLAYLNNELSLINNTFFYQAMLAEFQYEIYVQVESGNVMSADELNKLFGKLYIKYYGDSVKSYIFEDTNSYWSQISHFYSGFYVYKYSTSVAIAYSIKDKINSGEISRDKYLTFLEHGSILSPSDSLKTLDIDLKSDKWMDSFFIYYKSLVDEYEELLLLKESESKSK